MSEDDHNVSTNGGLFVQNTINTSSGTVFTPTKAIPVDKLQGEEAIVERAQNVAERYKELHSGHLEMFERNGDLRFLERQHSKTDPYDLVIYFFAYTDAFPLSKEEIHAFVELSKKYSDIITPPIQVPLLEMILYPEEGEQPEIDSEDEAVENSSDPDYFQLYQTGVERYLEVVEGSGEAISAPVPLLNDHYQEVVDLLSTIIEHSADIDMWTYNMIRRKPTAPKHRDYIQAIHNYLRRHGVFSPTLKYAINVRHSYATDEDDIRSAEDLALTGYGFDIIGENHWSPPKSGSFQPEPEARLFDQELGAYHAVPPVQRYVNEIWPELEGSSFDPTSILHAANDNDLGRIQKPINAERLEILLSDLRSGIADGDTKEFIEKYEGMSRFLENSLNAMAENWDQPDSQSTLDEHS